MSTTEERLRRLRNKNTKKEKFIRMRMWMGVLMSYLFPDRGNIPENIGNSIMISNNQYITKYSITQMILITDLDMTAPIAFMSKLIQKVKESVSSVRIDYTIKDSEYYPNMSSGGLKSRITQWENTLSNEDASENSKVRAARLLFTVNVARSKEKIYKGHVYVYVRAADGRTLRSGVSAVSSYLDENEISYKHIKSDIETHLKHSAILSNKSERKLVDTPSNILSSLTIAEMLPATQGLNDTSGSMLGVNEKNKQPYLIDFRKSSNAKNILLAGLSGFGKTFLVLNWLLDFYALMYNICIVDIKGNEFSAFTKACNGISLQMRSDSVKFVNTFTLTAKGVIDTVTYFDEKFNLSKEQLLIIANLQPAYKAHGEAFVEQLLTALYNELGVSRDNPNTWFRTKGLTPYAVYDFFTTYVSQDIKQQYSDVIESFTSRFKIYLSPNGSGSHIFREEYAISDILNSRVVTFDFGILDSSRVQDSTIFKIHMLYMDYISNEYARYKKSLGEWSVFVGEESQVAEDYVLTMYSNKITLSRAQNMITIILGNSVSALAANPIAKPILDNINLLGIGLVHKSSRDYLVNEFGLEKYIKSLEKLCTDNGFDNVFLLINKMQKDGAPAWLKAYVPEDVAHGKVFHNVDVE